MKSLNRIEIQWIISALNHTADDCKAQADELTGVLQGLALQLEGNNRATADKLIDILNGKQKRIEIK